MPPTTKKLLKSLVSELVGVLVGVHESSESSEHLHSLALWHLSEVVDDSLLGYSDNGVHNALHHKLLSSEDCLSLSKSSHKVSDHSLIVHLNHTCVIFIFFLCFFINNILITLVIAIIITLAFIRFVHFGASFIIAAFIFVHGSSSLHY